MKTTTTTTYRKKQYPPSLENKNDLTERLIKSLSKHSGYSEEDIKNSKSHHPAFWRKIAVYLLVEKYDWTMQGAADVFEQTAPNAYNGYKSIERLATTDGKKHLVMPYVNQVYHDLTL